LTEDSITVKEVKTDGGRRGRGGMGRRRGRRMVTFPE